MRINKTTFIRLQVLCFICLIGIVVRHPRVVRQLTTNSWRSLQDKRGRIVGGENATRGQFPWIVSLARNENDRAVMCGGSLITPSVIVTAAHCHNKVFIADYNRFDQFNDTGVQRRHFRASDMVVHSMYSSETQDYDIALIKLDKPFTNAQLVKPNYDPKVPVLNGLKLIVVGWGSTVFKGEMSNSLQFTRLRYIPHDECLNRFGGRYVTDSMLCAYEEGMDACQGDSGGPIITLNEDFEEILVGLVSWGVGCASSYPGVYTRLSHVADWIDETICGPNGLDPEECTLKSDHVSEPSSSPQSLEAEEKKNLVSQTNLKNSLTEDAGCHDMTTKFESKGKKKLKRSCDWVKKQLEERCDHYFVECPVTCGICGENDEDEQKSNQ